MKRSLGLDIIRGFAVILVLFRHAPIAEPEMSHPVLLFLEQGGWIGVDMFFVLSGFLVAGLLFKEYRQHERVNVGNFLIRRGMKIYPSFYFMVFAIVFAVPSASRPNELRVLCELVYLQNYCSGLFFHTWSLAVEEHFYLLLSLLVLALLQFKKAGPFSFIPTLYLFLMVSCLILRLNSVVGPDFFGYHLKPTHLRIDSLMCGVAVAYFYHFHRARFLEIALRMRFPAFLLGLTLLSFPFFLNIGESFFVITFGFTLLQIGAALILISTLAVQIPANGITNAIAFIGLHSYSIYLWHGVIAVLTGNLIPKIGAPVYISTSIIFGLLFGICFEAPVLKLRDRFFPTNAH